MAEMYFVVRPGNVLTAMNDQTAERIEKMAIGSCIRGDFRKMRSPGNHRRFFVLLDIAFDAWEQDALPVMKNREKFRHDIIIAAGYYETVFDLDGMMTLVPKSISFSSLDEIQFKELFSAVVQVVLDKILTTYTKDDLEKVIDEVLRF